jgi:death-on-curing protein
MTEDPEIDISEIDIPPSEREAIPTEISQLDVENLDQSYDQILYPSVSDIKSIHSDIIEEDEDASPGIINGGQVDFAIDCIKHGHFGQVPETIHEKAFTLIRLLAANHAFTDGNKRTALNTTWTFYAMNGYYFSYGEEIKAILKLLAVKEEMVDYEEVTEYFEEIAYDEESDRAPTQFVKMNHLFAWHDDVAIRFRDQLDALRQGDIERSEFSNTTVELFFSINKLVEFREENQEDLPEETIDYINSIESDAETILKSLREILQAIDEAENMDELREMVDNLDGSENTTS